MGRLEITMPVDTSKGLQVINASFNKTGTKSLTDALRILGHNVQDCQESVYRHYPEWERLWNCQEPASHVIKDIYGPGNKWNYTACSDTPGNVLWETLLENFPDAKVILILRDEDKWIESFRKFFEAEQKDFAEMKWHRLYGHLYRFIFPHTGRPMRVYMDFLRPLVLGPEADNFFGYNRTFCLKNFREHNAYVQAKCPKDKLLIYRFGDGWEPLCKFLDLPVPKQPFPWSNRAASVIYELSNHPDYIATWKRQFLCFGIRAVMIGVGVYFYKNPCEEMNEFFAETWKKVAAAALSLFLFWKA